MNLKEHKALLCQYEQKLEELDALHAVAKDKEIAWNARRRFILDRGPYLAEIPIPPECAAKLLQEHTRAVECEAVEMAKRLGVTQS